MDLESDLYDRLVQEGLRPERWTNGPFYRYAVHDHWYDKVLLVAKGSITFTLYQGREMESKTLKAGERLEIPAHTAHSAISGPTGVVCFEARRE